MTKLSGPLAGIRIVEIEGIGPVTGRFRLYSDRISGGKSENITRQPG